MTNAEVWAWQKRLKTQPQVWGVFGRDGWTGNLYATSRAAEREVLWRSSRGEKAHVEIMGPVMNDELAEERWK